MHETRELPRHLGRRLNERNDVPALDLERDDARVLPAVASDRAHPRDHLVEHHADGVEVRARVDLVRAPRLLGRHVLRGPHHDAGDGQVLLVRVDPPRLGDPEVDELEHGFAAREGDEDVLRLEVAMDDAERVRRLEGLEDLDGVLASDRHRELSLPLDDARERLALEELHHDVRVTVGGAIDVDDLHDVRAPDLGDDPRLLQEALDEPGAASELRVQAP